MTWRAIIEDEAERARTLAVVDEVAEAMERWPQERTLDGLIDHALLRAYLGRDDDAEEDRGAALLGEAVAQLGGAAAVPGLHGGAARVGWAIAHLADGPDADAVGDAVQRQILGYLDARGTRDDHYDLISGVVGFGVLALERGAPGLPLALRVLDELERTAVPRHGGLAWFTPRAILPEWQAEQCPRGYWNLGLAHGAPGAIALLARFVAAGVEAPRARALLDGAVRSLLADGPRCEEGRFRAWTVDDQALPLGVRRVAWCYGDLGVAAALAAAADATGDASWRAEALDCAHLAARCAVDRSGVIDCGLCHGAAGAAHVFNRLHQATGDAELGDAARTWLARTLAMRRAEDIAGFPQGLVMDRAGQWAPDAHLLTGAPGVALVLAAACTEVEPLWDRLLLCDLAPR